MIKIVNGKRYNTETAEIIADFCNGYDSGDFNYFNEDLHKTKKGAYFISGHGGPLSKYAESCGNGSTGGEDIRVLTENEAYKWLEETGNTEALESEFPDRVEDA